MSKVEVKSGKRGIRGQLMNILLLIKNQKNSYLVVSKSIVVFSIKSDAQAMTDDQMTSNKPATNQQQTSNKPATKQQQNSNKPAATHRGQRAQYIIDTAYSTNSLCLPALLLLNKAMELKILKTFTSNIYRMIFTRARRLSGTTFV